VFVQCILAKQPYVLIESQDMARIFGKNRADQAIIATCARRITASTQLIKGTEMDYINQYISMLELFESLPNVYIFEEPKGIFRRSDEPA
jgi:hypothetical protein